MGLACGCRLGSGGRAGTSGDRPAVSWGRTVPLSVAQAPNMPSVVQEEEAGALDMPGTGRPVAVREVVDNLNESRSEPLAYTTVMTVMSRLAEKDALSRRKSGRSYVYEANAPDAAGIAVKDVLRAYGDVAVAHFVDEARADPSLRRRLQRLLDEDDG